MKPTNTDSPGISPVLGMHFSRFENNFIAQGGSCVDDGSREGVYYSEGFPYTAAFSARAGGVKVEGVEAVEAFLGGG